MDFKILLVGCGNVGSRHLQGLLSSRVKSKIYVIEKSKKAILIAKQRINEIKTKRKKVVFFKNYNLTERKFDLLICATTSKKRYYLLNYLIKKFSFKKLIIEKIAFQNLLDFSKAINLLKTNKIKCWVNCTRREQKIYKLLKKKINKKDKLIIKVNAKKWNIASNAIHFIDLYRYFKKNEKILNVKHNNLKKINSKHKGFYELTGKIILQNQNDEIHFDDTSESQELLITIESKNFKILLNETKGKMKLIKKNKIKNSKFIILKQSELSKIILDNIYKKKKIFLPTLHESFFSHRLLFQTVGNQFYTNKKINNCPIT